MDKALKNWLKRRFRDIQDVKYAAAAPAASLTSLSHEPDLVVETWMNSRLYVHLCHQPPKPRTLKSILKQNTQASIGTLFLVHAALLPADGYVGRLTEWQDDLRVLNGGAIAAFAGRAAPALLQVNFDATSQRSEYTVWHSRDFPFDAVSVRRREYHSHIRGSWYVGDIASAKFKRRINEERARQRFHYRTKQTQPLSLESAEGISAAYLALEIEVGAGQAAVKDAFRRLARKYHPDVSEHQKDEAEARFREVKSAYEQIKSHRRWH